MRRYMCGTPAKSCGGGQMETNGGFQRVHVSPQEAFKCYRRHLVLEGYELIGSRELRPPGGGPILVLSKPSHFGGELRGGKRAANMGNAKRLNPKNGKAGLMI